MSSELKAGDHVRVTFEGKVRNVALNGDKFYVRSDWLGFDALVKLGAIEKLAEPEPEWVNGDVIRVRGESYLTYVWTYRGWGVVGSNGTPDANSISSCWRKGEVEILHKVDAS